MIYSSDDPISIYAMEVERTGNYGSDYYDDDGKVIASTIGWNELHPDSGKTYKFKGTYFNEQAPKTAEIKVVDSAKSKTPFYTENITIVTSSGV